MKLIVGLGNPGQEYAATRHNIGFMTLDLLAKQLGQEFCDLSRWQAATAEVSVDGEKVVLLKPQTYMNRSGISVGKFAHFYKLDPADIWVVSDELDLPLGRIRIRQGGSSGGHNGLKSIIEHLGSDNFYRIRLGISLFDGNLKATDQINREPEASVFVLQPFEKREVPIVETVTAEAANIILKSLKDGEIQSHTLEPGVNPTVI